MKTHKTVSLTEYGDYECPHCGRAFPVIKKIQKEFGARLDFNFKNFPLVEMHPHALMAAEAAEAARAQGKFDEMHDALFENQENLSPALIARLAEKIGLDLEKFSQDWSSHKYVPRIQKDLDEGLARGVQGTPAFFINGRFFDEQWTFESLSAALRAELKPESKSAPAVMQQ
jgi:protein-disulfide isomerase